VLFEDINKKTQPSDADVVKEYERVKAQQGAMAQAVQSPPHSVKEEAEAKQVLADLQNGGISPRSQRRNNRSRIQGRRRTARLVRGAGLCAAVRRSAENSEEGEMTKEPVKTNYGYHIIELQDVRALPFRRSSK